MVKIRVPASTSNLGSGFDCFGLALKLYLTVEMDFSGSLEISAVGEGCTEIPKDETNLFYQSAQKIFNKVGKQRPGLKIKIENRIPLSRGLGSSGAAIIAGLVGASKLAGIQLTNEEILNLANDIEGHPENAAAALLGGLTINCVSDGRVLSKKIFVAENLRAVLVIPELRISTHEARNILPRTVTREDAVFNLQRSALLAHAFIAKDYPVLKTAMQDRLHQPFRKHLIPSYDVFEHAGYQNGALGVCISGSGSAILGIVESPGQKLQRAWQSLADQLNLPARVLITEFENRGAEIG
jgi:homoserine kinase